MDYCRPSKDIIMHLCYVPGWNNAFLRFLATGESGHEVSTTGDIPVGDCPRLCYKKQEGSVVQLFMGLPRTRKGHGSSPSRGACSDLISFHFHNSEFNRCGGID